MHMQSTSHRFLLIDDHEAILSGILPGLQARYPTAEITTAKDVETAEKTMEQQQPNFVVVDLILPAEQQDSPSARAGVQLLERLMNSKNAPSLMVLSSTTRPLIRLKSVSNAYEGGFVALDKSMPLQDILNAVDIALRGSIYLPPEVRSRPEFDRRWLQVLTLKYEEGLSDRAIAQAMNVSDRTIRNYWARIQDALNVYDDPNKDLRMQIQSAARKAGLIA